jgi:MFS family permease
MAVLCTGVFLGAIDAFLVNVAFPDMLRSFHGSDLARLSWVMTGYTTAFTAALLPAGGLADRHRSGAPRRRRTHIGGRDGSSRGVQEKRGVARWAPRAPYGQTSRPNRHLGRADRTLRRP